ncbi:MAG: hypothetical protein MR652_01910 [Blautia sp.]|uniref:hypothetical protein n=1 Tax=Blautia sp. TaxID=1955243 RepID=UPI0025C70996|nr:hypothetical protein [Blautia sp.]MCI6301925.1 hypothetical protein [Blautia sp.]MDD6415127.1 hypothetical protein [Blautia sp.]
MKRKVLAFLVASTMVVNPFIVVNAADFSDSVGQETEMQFDNTVEDTSQFVDTDNNQFSAQGINGNITVTGKDMKWKDYSTVEISFMSNISGKCYIKWVRRGDNVPTINLTDDNLQIEANEIVTEEVTDLPDYDVDQRKSLQSNCRSG